MLEANVIARFLLLRAERISIKVGRLQYTERLLEVVTALREDERW
jgi:hypothetical protein